MLKRFRKLFDCGCLNRDTDMDDCVATSRSLTIDCQLMEKTKKNEALIMGLADIENDTNRLEQKASCLYQELNKLEATNVQLEAKNHELVAEHRELMEVAVEHNRLSAELEREENELYELNNLLSRTITTLQC